MMIAINLPHVCLIFPSLDALFKELCARRLLSAGENEYITAYIFCQHFLKFFFIFFCFFSAIFFASPCGQRTPPHGPGPSAQGEARAGAAGDSRDATTAKAGSPAPGVGAAPLWSRGPWPVPACGHRGLPSGATAAAGGFAP